MPRDEKLTEFRTRLNAQAIGAELLLPRMQVAQSYLAIAWTLLEKALGRDGACHFLNELIMEAQMDDSAPLVPDQLN